MNVLFKCPKCGNMSNPGKFCRYCGAKLNERVLTFENTNTLLRSNVVIKDNIVAHEDDVMDETERNVTLEIHDKDGPIDNNIYSFSNDNNKDHHEDYDGSSFRNESNGSQPELIVNKENGENLSESSFIEDNINNEDIDFSNISKGFSLDSFSIEDGDESIVTAEMEDVDESIERSSDVFMPLSERRKNISNTQDLLNRDIAIDSESKNQENEPFDTTEETVEEVQESSEDTTNEEPSLVLSENETLETENYTSSNYYQDEGVSEPFDTTEQMEEDVQESSKDTTNEEPSLVLGENETLETENYTSSNYYQDESVSEPFDTTEQIEEDVQEFNTDTYDEKQSSGFGENEAFETEKYTSSNYCADESVSEPFDTTEQMEEEAQESSKNTYNEEPPLALGENETRGATEKNSNLPLDVTEKDQFSDPPDKNSGDNIADKEDSIVVSSGTGYIDSMFGELPTFDTELIKKNYEQSLINRSKTEKKKHKFWGKKKTE